MITMQNNRSQTSFPNHSRKPVLSLILCSRNDQYMGNSLWRLQTTLNYTAQNVSELGRESDVEIIITDWGSKIPLREALELTPAAARITSFIFIPPQVALVEQKDSPFPEVLALNAAVRRSNGQYIGRIDQDTLVGKRFLSMFFKLHEGTLQLGVPLTSALLFAGRRSIPYRIAVGCPPLWAVERFIHYIGRFLTVERALPTEPFYVTYVGVWLLHRDLWNECGGYDEQWIYMFDMEMEMIARLRQKKYDMINLGMLGDYDFYHLDHYDPQKPRSPVVMNRKLNPKIDMNLPSDYLSFHPNNEDWGLIKYPLEIVPYSPGQAGAETESLASPLFKWPAFVLLLASAGAQMVYDNLVLQTSRFVRRWKYRAVVVSEAVHGQSVSSWPTVLKSLWVERRSRLRQREEH
jgi:hypothetical protein